MVGKLAWGVGRQRLSAGVYKSVTHNPRGLGFSFGASAPFFLFKYIQLLYDNILECLASALETLVMRS